MAQELNLSVRTVESHRANLMGKLHLQTRVELVRYARSAGIVK
jgi:two-component system response regulator NreC